MAGPRRPDFLPVENIVAVAAFCEGDDRARVGAARGLGDAECLKAQAPDAILAGTASFCSALPCLRRIPIVYICAWQAALLQPARCNSSRIATAAESGRPLPPLFLRHEAAR